MQDVGLDATPDYSYQTSPVVEIDLSPGSSVLRTGEDGGC